MALQFDPKTRAERDAICYFMRVFVFQMLKIVFRNRFYALGIPKLAFWTPKWGSVQSGHFSFKSMVPFDVKISLSGRSSFLDFFLMALISSNAENRKPLSFFSSEGFL